MVPLIIGAAAISAASGLIGAKMSSDAALDAARMSAEQEQKGLDFQKGIYEEQRKNFEPYVESGKQALQTYNEKLAGAKQPEFNYTQPEFNFSTYEDPGAKYQMQQAARALQASSLARGAAGGGFAKALMEKNQEMANTAYGSAWQRYLDKTKINYGQETDKYARNQDWFNNIMNRYQGQAAAGQGAAGGQGTVGAEIGKGVQLGYNSMGQSLASGSLGSAGAWNQGLSSTVNALGQGLGAYQTYAQQQRVNPNLPTYENRYEDSSVTRSNLGIGVA